MLNPDSGNPVVGEDVALDQGPAAVHVNSNVIAANRLSVANDTCGSISASYLDTAGTRVNLSVAGNLHERTIQRSGELMQGQDTDGARVQLDIYIAHRYAAVSRAPLGIQRVRQHTDSLYPFERAARDNNRSVAPATCSEKSHGAITLAIHEVIDETDFPFPVHG